MAACGGRRTRSMKWLPWIWQKERRRDGRSALRLVQRRFAHFLSLLDANNRVLKLFSDFEEKAHGDFLFDINYIRSTLAEIRDGVRQIIEAMIALGGADYAGAAGAFRRRSTPSWPPSSPASRPIPPDELTISFEELDRDRAASVGSKNAQLGEITSKLGLPVPGGFRHHGLGLQALHRRQRPAAAHRPVHRASRFQALRRPGLDEREDPEPGPGQRGSRRPGGGDPTRRRTISSDAPGPSASPCVPAPSARTPTSASPASTARCSTCAPTRWSTATARCSPASSRPRRSTTS